VALLAKPEKAEIQASTFDIPVREPLSLVSEPEGTRLPDHRFSVDALARPRSRGPSAPQEQMSESGQFIVGT
jgi:hypothetical protein